MGILPGGTGNGFATELGIPADYRKAVEVVCTSKNLRRVDAMRIGDGYGIHGTPDPEKVGRTESHGCFRLANWDALTLTGLVTTGLPVFVEP